ncbi:MAG: hypothetical protein IT438_14810 [Phycisphaerales bacterium]|nr:hypothetical protein [Phycisphaerales bacterium]
MPNAKSHVRVNCLLILVALLGVLVVPNLAAAQQGACCQFNGCVLRNECECKSRGHAFQGVGTACSPNPCAGIQFGACCFGVAPQVGCFFTAQSTCTQIGQQQGIGTSFQQGQTCTSGAAPCFSVIRTGACCCSGACVETDPAVCLYAGGVYHPNQLCLGIQYACCDAATGQCTLTNACGCAGALGSGTTCTPNPCPQPPVGTCCAGVACSQVIQANCGGSWTQGGSCSPNPCSQPTGVCCLNGLCSVTTLSACAGNWGGAGTTCINTPCGTCCSAGGCAFTTQNICGGLGGAWSNGGSCTLTPCGACCAGANCTYVTPPLCAGAHAPGLTCSPNPCPSLGACCTGNTCTYITQAQCGGFWFGAGTTCSVQITLDCLNGPLGACCNSLGFCSITSQSACPPGDPWHLNTQCSAGLCDPLGACCHGAAGACSTLTQSGCNNLGGTWLMSGNCQSLSACFGACCDLANGACTFTAISRCATSGTQVFAGYGSGCSHATCDAFGACCEDATGTCSLTTAAGCIRGAPTTYLGTGSVCAPNPCPQPLEACCTYCGRRCQLVAPGVCTPRVGILLPAGSACAPDPCEAICCGLPGMPPVLTTQAQCLPGATWWPLKPPGSTISTGVQCIFDFLADYFGSSMKADCDGNCSLTVNDLFCFLARYFSGCGC